MRPDDDWYRGPLGPRAYDSARMISVNARRAWFCVALGLAVLALAAVAAGLVP